MSHNCEPTYKFSKEQVAYMDSENSRQCVYLQSEVERLSDSQVRLLSETSRRVQKVESRYKLQL